MDEISAKKIVENYVAGRMFVSYHDIERDIQDFGRRYYSRHFNITTYARKFRELKELGSSVFDLVPMPSNGQRHQTWQVNLRQS